MALPRLSPRPLQTLLALFGFVLPVAYGTGSRVETGGSSCIDFDDTGLMQAPVRGAVDATASRSVVGKAKEQAGQRKRLPVPSAGSKALFIKVRESAVKLPMKTDASAKHMAEPKLPGAKSLPAELAALSQKATEPTSVERLPTVAAAISKGVSEPEIAEAPHESRGVRTARMKDVPTADRKALNLPLIQADPSLPAEGSLSFFQVDETEDVAVVERKPADGSKREMGEVIAEDIERLAEDTSSDGILKEPLVDDDTDDQKPSDELLADTSQDPPVDEGTDDLKLEDDDLADAAQDDTEASLPVTLMSEEQTASRSRVPWLKFGGAARYGQALSLLVILALVAKAYCSWRSAISRPRDSLSRAMRQKLERMCVASGPEIRSACAMVHEETDKALSPGVLMRIQGRIVSRSNGDITAPLSGRSCVLHSASVSQHRHDCVHQPPVAFHSAATDFAVQLDDCPEMLLDVHGQDVFTFDMEAGRYACELSFGDAPDTWRSFVLAHLTPGVEGGGAKGKSMNKVDLGANGPLKFRECALVLGARVTCVGEVVRERNGRLCLVPWSPPAKPDTNKKTMLLDAGLRIPAVPWLAPKTEPWVRRLMISDDSRLLSDMPQLLVTGKCRSCT